MSRRGLEADSKRLTDLDELGPSAGTGIFVLANVEGSMHGESVDVCTLTDLALDEWLDGLDAAALRRTCRVLLGRKPEPTCTTCEGDKQVCNVCRKPGARCQCPNSALPTPMPCPTCCAADCAPEPQ